MNINKVLLIGGTGFLGASVAERLVANGVAVTVPTRRTLRAKHLWVLPTLQAVEADIHHPDRLAELICGQDAVINLAGVLHDSNGDFERVHVALPKMIADACVATGASRLIQMSALNASMDGPSAYLQSRYRGESAVLEVARKHPSLNVTVFRPSIIFGERDRFLNMLATLARFSPFVPLGSPDARFQPVWVEDVARAVVQSLSMPETFGHTYALAGPHEFTLRALLEFAMTTSGHRRPILPLGPALSMVLAAVFAGLGIVGVATGFLPVHIGDDTVGGATGALIGTAGIAAAFAVVVLALAIVLAVVYGLGFLFVGIAIFVPLVVLVSLFPVLAPFILIGLGIWWLLRRAKRKDADGGGTKA